MDYNRTLVSFANRGIYLKCIKRLRDSCLTYHIPHIFWSDYPPGSRSHEESPYGFKLYCIQDAIKRGFKTIVWADSACYAIKQPDEFFKLVEHEGVLFLYGNDNLAHYVNTKCLNSFCLTRGSVNRYPLISGSLFGFDFNQPKAVEFFNELLSYEKSNLFVEDSQQQDDLFRTHRHDEAVISCMLIKHKIAPLIAYTYFQGGGDSVMFKAGKDL